jgi:hypothetical protein
VKRSSRDESIQVVIHMCMEAMLRTSLYSYSYVKVAKMLCLSYNCLSSLQQNWKRGQNRFCLEARGTGERGRGRGAGRDDPNNGCTYE